MVNYSVSYKPLLLVLALALLFQLTVTQSRQSGPPLRQSNTNQNGNSRPQARNNQALPRSVNQSAGAGNKQSNTRAVANATLAPNSGKVSVQLSRVIQQDQNEIGEDRSFSNPSAGVEERVVFDRGNSSDGTSQPNFPGPQKQHFKPGKLLALLDNEFDPQWLSIDTPASRIERPPMASIVPDPDLADKQAALNFSIFTLYDSSGLAMQPQPGLVSLFKAWLHRYATCQMEYIWEEMDIRFWPRYIKRGTCINEQPCSWPPGMRCKQSRTKALKILRWFCDVLQVTNDQTTGRAIIKRDSPDGAASQAANIRVKPGTRQRNGAGGQKKKNSDKDQQARQNGKGGKRNNKNQNGRRKKEKRDAYLTDPDTTFSQDGVFCRWQPVSYTVVEKCSCGCSP